MRPMKTFAEPEPLTDAELDRLGDFLKSCKGGRAMNVEQLAGSSGLLKALPIFQSTVGSEAMECRMMKLLLGFRNFPEP